MRFVCGIGFAVSLAAGCGARTSLYEPDRAEGGFGGLPETGGADVSIGPSSSTGSPCLDDESCDDAIDCTIDSCGPEGCEHAPNVAACNDDLFCTVDLCDTSVGCRNLFSDDSCDDGVECTTDLCDRDTDRCVNEPCDGACDNGSFCDGVERCDSQLGCTLGPSACVLGLGCEMSACNETTDLCTHTLPQGCVPPSVHLLVTDAEGTLFDVTPFGTPTQVVLAPSAGGASHLDVAIVNGRWFAIQGSVVELLPFTNQIIRGLGPLLGNSLGAGPDGWLYAADNSVRRINPANGDTEFLGPLPDGHASSGDIAFVGDRLFVSTDSGCGGALVEFDIITGQATVLGGDGLGCVYGLASGDGVLFLINCDGKVGTYDPDTGEVRIFATTNVQAYGAERLP